MKKPRPLNVLVGCEASGIVRSAFRSRGHNAWSCDLKPAEDGSPYHLTGDVLLIVDLGPPDSWDPWDLFIVHPPCVHIASSGALHFKQKRADGRQAAAIRFFLACVNADVKRLAAENPVGIMSTVYRRPDQIIQPYNFGENASKRTGLWLKNLLPLQPTRYVEPRMVCACGGVYEYSLAFGKGCPHCGLETAFAKPRWANQTNSGQNRLSPSPERATIRARTYPGIAAAMAEQWGQAPP